MAKRRATSIYLPDEVRQALEEIARRERRRLSNQILVACEEYVAVHNQNSIPASRRPADEMQAAQRSRTKV